MYTIEAKRESLNDSFFAFCVTLVSVVIRLSEKKKIVIFSHFTVLFGFS